MTVFTRFVAPTNIRVKIHHSKKSNPNPNNKNKKTLTKSVVSSFHVISELLKQNTNKNDCSSVIPPSLPLRPHLHTNLHNSPTKKFLAQFFQSFHSDPNPKFSPKDAPKSASTVDLRSVFATFDKNDDGFITKQELRESLRNMGIAAGEKDVEDMVNKVDSNGDGLIDLDEFCKLFDSISGLDRGKQGIGENGDEDGYLREAFDVFDGNKDGLITVEELGLVLSSLGFTEGKKFDDCQEMIRKVDVDGDGKVNFDEFKVMMNAGFARIIPIS